MCSSDTMILKIRLRFKGDIIDFWYWKVYLQAVIGVDVCYGADTRV